MKSVLVPLIEQVICDLQSPRREIEPFPMSAVAREMLMKEALIIHSGPRRGQQFNRDRTMRLKRGEPLTQILGDTYLHQTRALNKVDKVEVGGVFRVSPPMSIAPSIVVCGNSAALSAFFAPRDAPRSGNLVKVAAPNFPAETHEIKDP